MLEAVHVGVRRWLTQGRAESMQPLLHCQLVCMRGHVLDRHDKQRRRLRAAPVEPRLDWEACCIPAIKGNLYVVDAPFRASNATVPCLCAGLALGACMGWQLDRNVGSQLIGKLHLGSFRCQSAAMHITLLNCVEESLHVHRCRSYQQSEKQM